jgi:hypothetical protein
MHNRDAANRFETMEKCQFGHNEWALRGAKQQRVCLICERVRMREYKKRPEVRARETEARAAWARKKKFGVSPADYAERMLKQNDACAICKGVNKDGRALAVDHDHSTNAIRDLLCGRCNTTLGRVNESPELLRAMADYLDRHNPYSGKEKRV